MPQGYPHRLDSWKEIARYLNRDLSTVRRWEKEKGLPVHRVPGGARQAIFAYSEEIDGWLRGNQNELQLDGNSKPDGWIHSFREFSLPLLAILLVVVAVVAFTVMRPGVIRRASLSRNQVMAWDSSERLMWSFPLETPLVDHTPPWAETRVRVVDLDLDGRQEVLAAVSFAEPRNGKVLSDAVYCLTDSGRLRWKYSPEVSLNFGGTEYRKPWLLNDWLPIAKNGRGEVWAAFAHSTWWPSFIVRIDAQGLAEIRQFNAGWVTVLNYIENQEGYFLLAGGLNNEFGAGFFSALKIDGAASSSPQTGGSAFECAGCPKEQPYKYYLFPRSELNVLENAPPNITRLIRVFDDRIEVRAAEIPDQYSIFEFSPGFALRSVSVSDLYWKLHEKLEKEGRIHHSTAQCRQDIAMKKIRTWTSKTGWTELMPQAVWSSLTQVLPATSPSGR
jgi:hypothetical protein